MSCLLKKALRQSDARWNIRIIRSEYEVFGNNMHVIIVFGFLLWRIFLEFFLFSMTFGCDVYWMSFLWYTWTFQLRKCCWWRDGFSWMNIKMTFQLLYNRFRDFSFSAAFQMIHRPQCWYFVSHVTKPIITDAKMRFENVCYSLKSSNIRMKIFLNENSVSGHHTLYVFRWWEKRIS